MDHILGITPFELNNNSSNYFPTPEVGEGAPPSKALLFKGGSISVISGRSSYLEDSGFKPYDDSHFNTQFAIAVTKALATLHALLRVKGKRLLEASSAGEQKMKGMLSEECENDSDSENRELPPVQSYVNSIKTPEIHDGDNWTRHVSRASLVSANLSIMCHQFEHENVSSRVTRKLESLQRDIPTFTQFLHFASAMQTESRLQSVGPICMCDVWLPTSLSEDGQEDEGDTLVIRLRGGSHLQAPPLRDVTWIWLTLLRPEILQDRYIELCESYCSAFNNTVKRTDGDKHVEELTLFDVMRDLGDNFLHGFLTIVHKFTVSGVWSLDRQLHTSEGIHSISESIGFLVDNGIIGSLFIA